MRYVGGKSRIATWVAEQIMTVAGNTIRYVEPFVGSGATFAKLAPRFSRAACGDAHEDLVLLWRAVAGGWVPPELVGPLTYKEQRLSPPSAFRGFVGYGSSFGGKWFGGYVNTAWDAHWQRMTKPYAQAASRSLVKIAPAFASAEEIRHACYSEWDLGAGDLVYCDPPYSGTLGYPGSGKVFESDRFWKVAGEWSDAGATVIVSEAMAPDGWSVLAERQRKSMLRVSTSEANTIRTERLFMRDGS